MCIYNPHLGLIHAPPPLFVRAPPRRRRHLVGGAVRHRAPSRHLHRDPDDDPGEHGRKPIPMPIPIPVPIPIPIPIFIPPS